MIPGASAESQTRRSALRPEASAPTEAMTSSERARRPSVTKRLVPLRDHSPSAVGRSVVAIALGWPPPSSVAASAAGSPGGSDGTSARSAWW